MLSAIKKKISLKITSALLLCLLPIFAFSSWSLTENRKQALERELFAKGRMAALVGAQNFSLLLEELLASGLFTREELFDENYQLITSGALSGSKIPKYHTIYDRYFDEHIVKLEDAFLDDEMIVFAVLVDRNGYLPTHNSLYSQPLTGDPDKDRIGNRTKRIFDDPVGLAAARYTGHGKEPVLKQIYLRDTGVLMWDIAAPVSVDGRHWGAFRVGFSMAKTSASIRDLRQTVLTASFGVLFVCTLLIMVLVGRFTKPLQVLTRSAQAIASGSRKEKIDLCSEDEVGVLVDAFNQMSEALRETTVSRDFFDMLLQSMHDLLIVSDANGRILSVNQATCEVLGYNSEDVLTHKVQDMVVLNDSKEDWFETRLFVRQNYTADVFLLNCEGKQFSRKTSAV